MKIVPISLPTPFYIGPVNVYLIPEDPVTLIDTGPKTKEAVDALRAALRKEGLAVAVRRFETPAGKHYGKFRTMVRSGAVSSFLAEISAASVT